MLEPGFVMRVVRLKKDVKDFLDAHSNCQIVNLDVVGSERHVKYALACVERAFRQGRNFSKKQNIELLLWITGERQIAKALERGKPKEFGVFVGSESDFEAGTKEGYFEDVGEVETKENELDFIERSALLWLETKKSSSTSLPL